MSKLSAVRSKIQSAILAYNLYKFDHVCWLKTILYNALWFGVKGIKKLPIYLYNDVQILSIGQIVIQGEMFNGMIKIGCWKPKAHNPTRWINNSKVIFHGNTIIRGGTTFENYGIVEFGKCVLLGESSAIMCQERIEIGDFSSIGFESKVMDTDFHYVLNTIDKKILSCKKAIHISGGSWIASNCRILKGTILPQNSIVAGGSMVNKDYSQEPPNTVFAGIPAKPIKNGYRRIFNKKEEANIHEYFRYNSMLEYHINESDINIYCFDNFF